MNKKKIMNWIWDHPVPVTAIVSAPTFIVVVFILIKSNII